uniref:Uncharacterized protein n=1 Tax=Acrobeloides nanus TaxID=290746 RepID=A0A914E1P3_9BILA
MNNSSKHVLLNGVILGNHSELVNENRRALASNDEALNYLTQKFSSQETIEREFQTIPTKRMSAGTSTSQYPENQARNRSRYILPYEDTRVMLHPNTRNPHGYINASNIQIPVAGRLFKYVITQAPLSNTIDDFWQMVWESNARVIVMLSNRHEEKAKLNDQPVYWPTQKKSKLNLRHFNIKLQNSTSNRFLTTSIMHIKPVSGGERRAIYHLHFSDFSTDSIAVPSSEDAFLGFIDAVNSVRRHVENERAHETNNGVLANGKEKSSRSRSIGRTSLIDVTNRIRSQSVENGGWRRKLTFSSNGQSSTSSHNSETSSSISSSNGSHHYRETNTDYFFPTIVHCVDGTSESGVYVLVEVLIHCFENNINVDIAKVLRTLRQQRMHLIRNLHQYRFVYSVIINYLQKSRLI